jgi:hypothetical protein
VQVDTPTCSRRFQAGNFQICTKRQRQSCGCVQQRAVLPPLECSTCPADATFISFSRVRCACQRPSLAASTDPLRQFQDLVPAIQSVDETLGNFIDTDACADKRSGEHRPCHVLTTAVNCVQYRALEILLETRSEVVGCRQLVLDRARHSVDDRYFRSGFDRYAWIVCCVCHVTRAQKRVGRCKYTVE